MTHQGPNAGKQAMFKLEYPQSLGVFDTYADAQKAVDHLADNHFPVANLAIVGTDLRLVERVTGRRTWGTTLGQGVMSGLSTGAIVAVFMMLLFPSQNFLGQLLTALTIGVVIGLLFAVLGYLLSRGQRDFMSVSQTIATKYELLCEHKVVAQARDMLASAPWARAAQFNQQPPVRPDWNVPPYGQQPGPQGPYPPHQAWPGQQQPYPGQQAWPPPAPQQPWQQPQQDWASPQAQASPEPPATPPTPANGSDPDAPYRPPSQNP